MSWQGLTTRGGNRPPFRGGRRGRPTGRKTMPRTKKDLEQDKQITNIKKTIRTIERKQEISFFDTMINGVALVSNPNTAHILLLNGMVEGDDDSQREKSHISYTSLQFKGVVRNAVLTVDAPVCRIIMFWDKQANGTAPTAAQLLDVSTITLHINAPYNKDYWKRFKIIYDHRFVLNLQAVQQFAVATGITERYAPVEIPISFRKRLNRMTNYGLGNTGTITDISSNSIYIMLLSDNAIVSNPPTLNAGIRLLYKDD